MRFVQLWFLQCSNRNVVTNRKKDSYGPGSGTETRIAIVIDFLSRDRSILYFGDIRVTFLPFRVPFSISGIPRHATASASCGWFASSKIITCTRDHYTYTLEKFRNSLAAWKQRHVADSYHSVLLSLTTLFGYRSSRAKLCEYSRSSHRPDGIRALAARRRNIYPAGYHAEEESSIQQCRHS